MDSRQFDYYTYEAMGGLVLHGLSTVLFYAPLYRAVERNYFNPDLNPFLFASGYTLTTCCMRLKFSEEPRFGDTPGVFMGAALSYFIAAKLFG